MIFNIDGIFNEKGNENGNRDWNGLKRNKKLISENN